MRKDSIEKLKEIAKHRPGLLVVIDNDNVEAIDMDDPDLNGARDTLWLFEGRMQDLVQAFLDDLGVESDFA